MAKPPISWTLNNKAEVDYIMGPEREDRVVGIVLCSMLEDRLKIAIKSKLQHHEKYTQKMFQRDGPLGDFGTQVNLGFMLGIYTIETHRDLITIRDIRNAFAHNIGAKDFETSPVKELVSNLGLIERGNFLTTDAAWSWHYGRFRENEMKTRREKFTVVVRFLLDALNGEGVDPLWKPPPPTPRF